MTSRRYWLLGLLGGLLLGGLALTGWTAWVDGWLPAPVPSQPPPFSYAPLARALEHVDSAGMVDYPALAADRAALDEFVASLAGASPDNRPDLFPTPKDRLAYWLNAYNALVLRAILDRYPGLDGPMEPTARWLFWGPSFPVGGSRLTLHAIEDRKLRGDLGDARIHFALNCGARGCPPLSSTPFVPEFVDAQLNEQARRYLARRATVRIEGSQVHLSELFAWYEEDFLAAVPKDRPKSVLQLVWAFLPDDCEERPGCDTRADLDRACGPRLDRCRVVYEPYDWALNDRTRRSAPR